MLIKSLYFSFGFVVLSVVFGLMAYFMTWQPILEWQRSHNWIKTQCFIATSKAEYGNDESWNYSLDYSYVVNGVTYQSERYSFDHIVTGRGPGDLPPELVIGKNMCYYNPDMPAYSVIEKEIRPQFWPGFWIINGMAAFSIVLGIVSCIYGYKHEARANQMPKPSPHV